MASRTLCSRLTLGDGASEQRLDHAQLFDLPSLQEAIIFENPQ